MTPTDRPTGWVPASPSSRGGPHSAAPTGDPHTANTQASPLTPGRRTRPTSPVGEPLGPQRQQRPRTRIQTDLLAVASRITDRDVAIATWLDEHDVFTTDQLTALFFHHPTTASHRLHVLYRIGWLNRFRRPKPVGGATAWHWVLGPLGAHWTAAAQAQSPPTPVLLRRRRAQLAARPPLGHRLGVHQLFIDLHRHATTHQLATAWWSTRHTTEQFLHRIHPDGAGRHGDVCFFVEHDTGTETITRLIDKLDAYHRLRADGGPA